VIELTISIDEALRFIISAGVIKPDTELRLKVPQIGEPGAASAVEEANECRSQ
jgi:uncharacterized membrane protein